jgi:uncharacterized protein (DUF952 family)
MTLLKHLAYVSCAVIVILCGTLYLFHKKENILNSNNIYKIIPESHFNKNNTENCIKLLPLDIDSGFIHTAFGSQVMSIVQKFFKGTKTLLVIELDLTQLQKQGTTLRVESNKPGGEKFPHLYGTQKIPVKAVKQILHLNKQTNDTWIFNEKNN